MARGYNKSEWSRVSCLWATIINANRDPKKSRAVRPVDLNPYATKEDRRPKVDFVIRPSAMGNFIDKKDDGE